MSITWNEGFEQEPAPTDSPSGGPTNFSDSKSGIRERVANEHSFDLATPGAKQQGWHRTGSAKVYFEESEPTFRPDGETTLTVADNGRLWIRPSSLVSKIYSHPDWIDISAELTAVVTIVGAQTIIGDKTFSGDNIFSGDNNFDGVLQAENAVINLSTQLRIPTAEPASLEDGDIWVAS